MTACLDPAFQDCDGRAALRAPVGVPRVGAYVAFKRCRMLLEA